MAIQQYSPAPCFAPFTRGTLHGVHSPEKPDNPEKPEEPEKSHEKQIQVRKKP